MEHLHFPNESAEYRRVRNALLEEEMALRRQVERVAAQRRALPPGGAVPEDYRFDGAGGPVTLSQLFDGKDTLAIYSFMFGPERERPCPGCTHFLDGLDGSAQHILQRLALVVVAKSPIQRLLDLARRARLGASEAALDRGQQLRPRLFRRFDRARAGDAQAAGLRPTARNGTCRSSTSSAATAKRCATSGARSCCTSRRSPGQEYRHNDLLDPVWNMFDVTPEGRGDFHPKLEYR